VSDAISVLTDRKSLLGEDSLLERVIVASLGRLPEPLLEPTQEERDGYVPNVVYSCGALVHAGRLILPYAMSDQCTSFVTVPLEELLSELKSQPPDSLL
jgi:predicted GH43/DUF377 family glycosyl hydrolase